MAAASTRPRSRPRQPRGRDYTVVARVERDGRVQCQAALVVVKGSPGLLGIEPAEVTVWFYGDVRPIFAIELEEMTTAAQRGEEMPAFAEFELILLADGGEMRLPGCTLGMPTRVAGPATTLEYRVSHPGRASQRTQIAAAA